jgi:hypothetical protein
MPKNNDGVRQRGSETLGSFSYGEKKSLVRCGSGKTKQNKTKAALEEMAETADKSRLIVAWNAFLWMAHSRSAFATKSNH